MKICEHYLKWITFLPKKPQIINLENILNKTVNY